MIYVYNIDILSINCGNKTIRMKHQKWMLDMPSKITFYRLQNNKKHQLANHKLNWFVVTVRFFTVDQQK